MKFINELIQNYILLVPIFAISSAQIYKLFTEKIISGKWNFRILYSTGGMPSSHAAFVSALAVIVGLEYGLGHTFFAISVVLAMVVIHDAMGIRRHASKQARTLNSLVEDVNEIAESTKTTESGYILKNYPKLKELLGHEPMEALMGTLYGVVVAVIGYLIFLA